MIKTIFKIAIRFILYKTRGILGFVRKTFLLALKDNIEKYEKKFGEIKVIKNNLKPNINLSDKDILPN